MAVISAPKLSGEEMQYAVEHVFLPPMLPQNGDEPDAASHESALLIVVFQALESFRVNTEGRDKISINGAIDMIRRLRNVRDVDGFVTELSLRDAFRHFEKNGGVLPIHVKAQNAGLIVTRENDSMIFEPFELSPTNNAAMNTLGRLKRCFPASSISLKAQVFADEDFQTALAHTIAKMSRQEVAAMKPRVRKAGDEHIEERDTTSPAMVTDFLASVLTAMGEIVQRQQIWKNTREEVLWSDARSPWRRSPLWLLVRVMLQAFFARSATNESLYKEFMIFLMAYILRASEKHSLPSELLYCMMAKTSRRLLKLNEGRSFPWLPFVDETFSTCKAIIGARWKDITQRFEPTLDMRPISLDEIQRGSSASYPELDKFIESIKTRTIVRLGKTFKAPWVIPKMEKNTLPHLAYSTEDAESLPFSLAAYEDWIAKHLDSWLGSKLTEQDTCEKIYNSARAYYIHAEKYYSGNPEGISVMLLTMMELWVANDKSACAHHQLMLDYDPQMPLELLQSLILPFKGQMERLGVVEKYGEGRLARAIFGRPSIFTSFGRDISFSVRYFAASPTHRLLKQTIESKAREERQAKRNKFEQRKKEYDELMRLHESSNCSYVEIVDRKSGRPKKEHDYSCKRCRYSDQAKQLRIKVHEWPLPEREYEAQSVVFELRVPKPFNDWRNMSIFCKINVLKSVWTSNGKSPTKWTLANYLSQSYDNESRRMTLVSSTKPNEQTHRNGKLISTCEIEDILVANGMTYAFFDKEQNCFLSDSRANMTEIIPKLCMYQLSEKSMILQDFLFRPFDKANGPSPNEVISRQARCPDHLSLEEFKAMAVIPVGFHLQWLNILTNLHIPSIDFKKPDTVLILLQATRQAGPPSKNPMYRHGHRKLCDDEFIGKFIQGLLLSVERIKENWESFHALTVFIALTSRLLSLSPSLVTSKRCLSLLKYCRLIALDWLHDLQSKIQESHDEAQRRELLMRLFQIAHVCVGSFYVDDEHLQGILQSTQDASILIESCFIIQTNLQISLESDDAFHKNLMQTWYRFMHRCHEFLSKEVVQNGSSCLDDAIFKTWSAYPGGTGWTPLSTTASHWLTTQTAKTKDFVPQTVYFNLLTAELLVNGIPLSRLPSEYEKHPSYRTLFGRTMIEVMPASMPGVQFSSKEPYHEYEIYFGKGDSGYNDLTVVAIYCQDNDDEGGDDDQRTFDFIPPRIFRKMLPDSFVNDYVHWYNRETDSIEFRIKKSPWTHSDKNWKMKRHDSLWLIQNGDQGLLSPACPIAKRLSSLLSPLEGKEYVHVIHHSSASRLQLELPRSQLIFWADINSDKIYCRQYRGMYIDPLQELGTLIGLESKLILRDQRGKRKVLIPNGQVQWESSSGHIRVSISYETSTRVYSYDVDELLGRLVDNGHLQSKLILCYLHALASYCLPDPLTGNTGTEQSLSILNSAAVRSFDCLSKENIDILQQIGSLSPQRSYYPESERVMEKIVWTANLSSLSQHLGFYTSVKSILEQAASTSFFYPDTYFKPEDFHKVDPQLEKRQCIRASVFQIHGFGAEKHTVDNDSYYSGRGKMLSSTKSHRAYAVSMAVHKREQATYDNASSAFVDTVYDYLKRTREVSGPSELLSDIFVSYDAKLIGNLNTLIGSRWCDLHATLSTSYPKLNRTRMLLFLAAMAYSEYCEPQVMQALVAFANLSAMGNVNIPQADSYFLVEGRHVDINKIKQVAGNLDVAFFNSPDSSLSQHYGETMTQLHNRRYDSFQQNRRAALDTLASSLQNQWVCESPRFLGYNSVNTYLRMPDVEKEIGSMWGNWYQNHQFYDYLTRICDTLRNHPVRLVSLPVQPSEVTNPPASPKKGIFMSESQLFQTFSPPTAAAFSESPHLPNLVVANKRTESAKSAVLLQRLTEKATRTHERKYAEHLAGSFRLLESHDLHHSITHTGADLIGVLRRHRLQCKLVVDSIYQELKVAVQLDVARDGAHGPNIPAAALFVAPRISPTLFLRQLASDGWKDMPEAWKQAIVAYGLALSNLQRARRMLDLAESNGDLLKELLNEGHANWDPLHYPKSLLLEVESGIMIRANQADIAAEMGQPLNNANAVMQLNMGEGKSSVIVPIVAAHLANGKKLIRVIVAKPQAKELYKTLIAKLGGMLNHRIYHLPFSRSLKLTNRDATALDVIHRECMTKGGVFLVQPEQILSLKLMGAECMSSGKEKVGRILLSTQRFLDDNTRDLVDESDENFSTKFELIYTMGDQGPIELSPERWILIQKVLSILARIVPSIKQQLPESIELNHHADGCFPRTRILRQDALDRLMTSLANEICKVGLPGLPIARQKSDVRESVFRYISSDQLSSSQIAAVEKDSSFYTEATKGQLLLIRGLIAEGLLAFALGQKRWRVNYGLTPNRQPPTKLAVPYRAKDSPSPRSEFSHVDVVILLTCLTYYYGGLSDDNLFLSFERLMKSDQADSEYHEWVREAPSLPESFRQLIGINLKDRYQTVTAVFPHLRFTKSVVDYFLAHIVFPKEMRVFPQKLSASGWDLGKTKYHPTTGFSGTNDSRHLLPLSMKQLDLEDQLHTNALVLEQLLRPENSVKLFTRQDNASSDAETLLNLVQSMDFPIQVILDVGAQILELTNLQVAKKWLRMVPPDDKEAVVFFNDVDELCVVDRRGVIEHLQTSPYCQQLDRCLVFLDESHTRGTDLKLPQDYRAAVTLGANLTKDRLVQACMRMRNLGRGQSVVFCVSEEIESKIRTFVGSDKEKDLDVSDVLLWSISETHADLRRNMPLWATQGLRFERQKAVWVQNTASRQLSSEQASLLLEDDVQSLESRYQPNAAQRATGGPRFSAQSSDLLEISKRCEEFDCVDNKRASLQEEQERELSPEIVQERQVQRPHPAEAKAHYVHPDVARFVRSGIILESSTAFIPAFQVLKNTSTAESFNVDGFPSDILATCDYMQTVKLSGNNSLSDSYQRPVQWILSNKNKEQRVDRLVIISPFEAQELMLNIEKSKSVSLHLYTPRSNLAFPTLDKLDLYTIPAQKQSWELPDYTRLLLNIFAGQLYFESFQDYRETCEMLGLAWQAAPDGVTVGADGFISGGPTNPRQIITKNPVKFLMVLLTKIRRDCESIDKTHWGRILGGEMLTEVDFSKVAEAAREVIVVLRPKV